MEHGSSGGESLTSFELAAPAAAPGALSLRRVVLSSGGLASFEYEATVSGDAALSLDVRLAQVDDVLKSLVVYDASGKVDAISLAGKAPASVIFRDVPFDQKALESGPTLLEALRGAEVRVETKDGVRASGRVVSVTDETVALPNAGGTVTRHRLAIAANGVVSTVILEDVTSLTFVDPALGAQLDAALGALLAQKARGHRTLVVHTTGTGDRVVRIAYVVEAPIWKTAYRLALPADLDAKTAPLQGWAIVDNQSGRDWRNINLTLPSGNPLAFRMRLYESYELPRPEAPVEVVGRVLPKIDLGVVPLTKGIPEGAPPPMAPMACGGCAGCGGHFAAPRFHAPPVPEQPEVVVPEPSTAPLVTPTSTVAATHVIFHFDKPVTITNGESAVLPIVDAPFQIERVSLYQPDTDARNPLASVQITNGDVGLPPGPVTVYERAAPNGPLTYAGDARLPTLPPREKRILSYAIDEKVRIDRKEEEPKTLTVGTIAGGILTLRRSERRTTVYAIVGAANEPRTVILEVPRIPGFELATPTKDVETTPDRYRIRVRIDAGKDAKVEVTQAKQTEEKQAIANLSSEEVRVFVSGTELPEPVRAALAKVADAQAAVAEKEAVVKSLEEERTRIVAEQVRIAANLKVVPAGGPLAARYLAELSTQEDRLAALQTQITAARAEVQAAKRALAEVVRGLHVA